MRETLAARLNRLGVELRVDQLMAPVVVGELPAGVMVTHSCDARDGEQVAFFDLSEKRWFKVG